jgi:hypothetical protein
MSKRVAAILAMASIVSVAPPAAVASSVPTIHRLSGHETGISCPTIHRCYAIGHTGVGGTLVTLTDGRQVKVQKIQGTGPPLDISCPTLSFCAIVAQPNHALGGVVTFSHGVLGKVTKLSWYPENISCPSAGRCVLAGTNSSYNAIATALLSNGKLSRVQRANPWHGNGLVNSTSLSCVSVSACELLGNENNTALPRTFDSFYASLGAGGKLRTVHTQHDTFGTYLSGGVSCLGSGKCWIAGSTATAGVLLEAPIGGKATQKAQAAQPLTNLSCRVGNRCTAATNHSGSPAIVSFTNGARGAELTFPQLSPLGPTCLARISASKFIAVWDGRPNKTVLATVS